MPLDFTADLGASSNAKDWVKHSRSIEINSKELAKQQAALKLKQLEEEEEELIQQTSQNVYNSKDLKGMKVMHDVNDFETEESIILTLADSSILETNDDGKAIGLNENDTDVLENVNLADDDRRKHQKKQLQRLKKPIYSALDDEEFDENGQGILQKRSILSQYDKEKKIQPKLELGEGGTLILNQLSKNIQLNQASATTAATTAAMRMNGSELLKDYYTNNEMKQQKKETKFKKKHEKKLRSKHLRKKNNEREEEEDDEIESMAMDTDDIASKSLKKLNRLAPGPPVKVEFQSIDLDDDDPELAQSIARARRIALRQHQEQNHQEQYDSNDRGAQIVRKLAEEIAPMTTISTAAIESKEDEKNSEFNSKAKALTSLFEGYEVDEADFDEELDTDGRRKDGTLVFNSTTEFATRLQARLNDQARLKTEAMVKELEQRAQIASKINEQSVDVQDEDPSLEMTMDVQEEETESNGNNVVVDDVENVVVAVEPPVIDEGPEGLEKDDADEEINIAKETLVEEPKKKRSRWDSDAPVSDKPVNSFGIAVGQKRSRWDDVDLSAEAEAAAAFAHEENNEHGDDDDNHPAKRQHREDEVEEDDDADVMRILAEEERVAEMEDSDESDEEEVVDDAQMGFLHRQPLVSKGMGATLALLKGSGELKHSEELAGRAKDQRQLDPSKNDFGVKLEYRDEFGRKLTQKEAFRQLSYRFHGYGPSKKKKEKRLKQVEIQNKATSSRAGILEGAGGTMKSLIQAQTATGKAHITVQGGLANATIPPPKLVAQALLAKQKKATKKSK